MTPRKENSNYAGTRGGVRLEAELKKSGWRPASNRCATCGNDLAFDTNCEGIVNEGWCSTCQSGTKPISRSSLNAMARGALVPGGGLLPALPTVRPGQLRCQRCAHGVEGTKRFCRTCTSDGLEVAI